MLPSTWLMLQEESAAADVAAKLSQQVVAEGHWSQKPPVSMQKTSTCGPPATLSSSPIAPDSVILRAASTACSQRAVSVHATSICYQQNLHTSSLLVEGAVKHNTAHRENPPARSADKTTQSRSTWEYRQGFFQFYFEQCLKTLPFLIYFWVFYPPSSSSMLPHLLYYH